jgi:2-methylcitrate dehydratase PrpD
MPATPVPSATTAISARSVDPHPGTTFAHFAAALAFEDIPQPVVRRAEDLLLDWAASALAGRLLGLSEVALVDDAEGEAAYPRRWIGRVEVETTDGRIRTGRVDEPRGDPGTTLSRTELAAKAPRLAEFGGAATAAAERIRF